MGEAWLPGVPRVSRREWREAAWHPISSSPGSHSVTWRAGKWYQQAWKVLCRPPESLRQAGAARHSHFLGFGGALPRASDPAPSPSPCGRPPSCPPLASRRQRDPGPSQRVSVLHYDRRSWKKIAAACCPFACVSAASDLSCLTHHGRTPVPEALVPPHPTPMSLRSSMSSVLQGPARARHQTLGQSSSPTCTGPLGLPRAPWPSRQ